MPEPGAERRAERRLGRAVEATWGKQDGCAVLRVMGAREQTGMPVCGRVGGGLVAELLEATGSGRAARRGSGYT